MSHHETARFRSEHTLTVYPAEAFRVVSGVNSGETLASTSVLNPGDGYQLQTGVAEAALSLEEVESSGAHPVFKTTETSDVEAAGIRVQVTAHLTLITLAGAKIEALVLACDGPTQRSYLHPLGALAPGADAILIDYTIAPQHIPLADMSGLCFGRGTRITMSDGTQQRVETLAVGDRVLTRDNGMQQVRWVGRRTVQATGRFAPVVISPGVLDNEESLTLGQTHRVLLSDWRAEVLVGARDVLICASDMINGTSVYVRSGGFIEYTQLVFDRHQLIYAEGIAAESLNISQEMLPHMPTETARDILRLFPDLPAKNPDLSRTPLDSAKAQTLLRQAGRIS